MNKQYTVQGMKCQGCAKTIQQRLLEVEGIQDVQTNIEQATVSITSLKECSLHTLNEALQGTAYVLFDKK